MNPVKDQYLKRIIDDYLDIALQASGGVVIEGAKWCGKTRAAKEKAKSVLFMQDPDHTSAYLNVAHTQPSILLKGATPRLIDEWQMAPVLWDAVRYAIDERGQAGQFILTGSAVPSDNAVMHTGTGRISHILMRPMSLYESLESNGTVSLKELFDGNTEIGALSQLCVADIAYALARGGWPDSVNAKKNIALRKAYDYVDAVINFDVSRVDNVEKDPTRVRALMRSLSRNIATMASISTIKNDIASDDASISDKTITAYLNALRRIFVIEDQPAWSPAMRSKTALRTSVKRHFVDPSIAVAALRATPESILEDFNTFGFLFESLCVRDLRIYAGALDGDVYHYRDKNELEADAIIQLHDGRWAAIEVKLGAKEIELAAKNLLALKEKIDVDKMKSPSFLMILTGTEFAYKRDDGVLVVPIGVLKD